jgi:hypothetical protein
MVWDSLTEKEKEKFQESVDDAIEKMLQDKDLLDHFGITEEEAKAQLAKRPKKKE